jgi:hypothetical protein
MGISTTQSIWRSGGGDNTRTAYCGTGLMVAEFYIDPTAADTTTVKVSSVANAPAVVLPAGAVVVQINANAAGTGGSTPTYNMGWIGYTDATAVNTDGLIAAGGAGAGKTVVTWATATIPGAELGGVMSSTQMVTLTGGAVTGDAATGGSITGQILYYVTDPLLGQQNV